MQKLHESEGFKAFMESLDKSIVTINQINADLRIINHLLRPLRKENAMEEEVKQ